MRCHQDLSAKFGKSSLYGSCTAQWMLAFCLLQRVILSSLLLQCCLLKISDRPRSDNPTIVLRECGLGQKTPLTFAASSVFSTWLSHSSASRRAFYNRHRSHAAPRRQGTTLKRQPCFASSNGGEYRFHTTYRRRDKPDAAFLLRKAALLRCRPAHSICEGGIERLRSR